MYCEKLRATFASSTCLKFQASNKADKHLSPGERGGRNWSKDGGYNVPHPTCIECEQGKEIKKNKNNSEVDLDVETLRSIHQGKAVILPNPKQRNKRRNGNPDIIIDFTKDEPVEEVEQATVVSPIVEAVEPAAAMPTTKICSSCQIEKPIEAYYNDCHQKSGKKVRCKVCDRDAEQRKKFHVRELGNRTCDGHVVSLDFSGYSEILADIRRVAEMNMRSTHNEILFRLKMGISNNV